MKLLNLHCHSNYTDGADSLSELAVAYENNSHIALVVTDHDYALTLQKWNEQYMEAQELSKKLNYPIIVGLEVFMKPLGEEFILLGSEACRSWFKWKIINGNSAYSTFMDWYKIQKDRATYHPFAMVLVHPLLLVDDQKFYSTMDGYEISNGGLYWGDEYVEKMQKKMPQAAPYHGIDLHCLSELSQRCNEVEEDLIVTEENDLINYLKSKREMP